MAFDAAPPVQAPTPGAGVSAKSAPRQGDASDPFGALLAMLDGAQTEAAPAGSTPVADSPADKADPAEKPVAADADKDAPAAADDDAAAPSAPDAATLVAAMMIPAAVTPPPAEAQPAPAVDATAAPVLKVDAPVVEADPEAAQTAPLPSSEPEIVLPTQTAQAEKPATPEPLQTTAPAAEPRPAAADRAADPLRADAVATGADPAGAPRTGAHGDHGQSADGGDGRPSDGNVPQQAANDAVTPDSTSFATAASAPAEAPAPAVGVAEAPAPPPVIAAQAAVAPVRGAPETVAHLAAQMIQRLEGQTTRFDLTLNPQSLGRVDVRIEIGLKGALRARLAFDDAATAQEMSGRHTELRAALQSAGFDVPEGALSFDVASGGGGSFAERQDADRSAAAPMFQNFADTADQDPAAAIKSYFSAAGSSGVDIRV